MKDNKELPIVDGIGRNLSFQYIEWVKKETFETLLSTNIDIFPNIKNSKNENIFIGKYIPRQQYPQNSQLNNDLTQIRSETIGQIEKDINGLWKLVVLHDYGIYEIKSDFLVLSIHNPDSYTWIETELDKIPKYALKAAIDEQLLEFVYIGCTVINYLNGYYYYDGWNEVTSYENTENSIGRFRINDKALHVVKNGLEVKYSTFKIFCLKPTPSTLKELCRISIRNYTKNTNVNIRVLNHYIPSILINYLKYPSCLNVGDYLLKGEKLISDDDKYELYIDHDNYLVCKNSITNSRLILYNHSFVDSIWLQKLQTIFFYSNLPKFFLACIFYENPVVYKFELCTRQKHPRFLFQIFNNKFKSFNNNNQILYNYFSHYDETYLKYFLENSVN
jgi:hypothetical protein